MRPLLLVWILLVPCIASGTAQGLTPSIFWKNPNITLSKDERITITSAALKKADSRLQYNGQFNRTMDMLLLGLTPLIRIQTSLISMTVWTTAKQATISKEQAATGTVDGKQLNLSLLCQGTTLAGGTYWSTSLVDPNLSGMTSSLFLVVSALLAEATSNQMYLNFAIESANFIQSHLLDPSNIVLDSLSSKSNESCLVNSMVFLYNSRIFIEGLAILASITHNTSTEALLHSTIIAIATDTLWQGLDGVIETMDIGGHHIVQALAALYEHNTVSSDLWEYIKEYIGVQYSAVTEKATSGGSNIYGLPWTGPQSTLFSSFNQTVAVTTLLSAIQLIDDEPSSKSSDNSTLTCTPTVTVTTSLLSLKKNPTGAIVASVVGGLTALVLTTVYVLLYCRQHRQGNLSPLLVNEGSSQILAPFMAISVPEILGEHHINWMKNARYPIEVSRGQSSASLGAVETDATTMDVQIELAAPLEAVVSPPILFHIERREDMPMEELLRLLNQWLLLGRWNGLDDELPLEYSERQTT
ncbi:hypothetical protein EDD85DRAFT_953386 [Armillaria nabsnona]|nr:hypothetical protein EDD85DRAFT_953386 [Armillaria nabsnona]